MQDKPLDTTSITPEVIIALQALGLVGPTNIGGSVPSPSTAAVETATVPASPTTNNTPAVIKSEHTMENEPATTCSLTPRPAIICPHVCALCTEQALVDPPANNPATTTPFSKADTTTNQLTADVSATAIQPAAPVTAPPTIMFHAPAANSHLANMDSWYAGTVGRNIGVFQGWINVQPLVSGVSGGSCKKYKTYAAARTAFNKAEAHGCTQIVC
ncbi:hypothetical protein C0991_002506 [Blastosporella zonata]|nr:hypothetical protein C0991_002506 [Blastosporella zonata]